MVQKVAGRRLRGGVFFPTLFWVLEVSGVAAQVASTLDKELRTTWTAFRRTAPGGFARVWHLFSPDKTSGATVRYQVFV